MSGTRRIAALRRKSRETDVLLRLDLDGGPAAASISTGIGFLDHMLATLSLHAGWALELRCSGDLEVDEHHSAEDCAIALGEALSRALARGAPPRRFASAYAPMDEALARAVVDLSGRPFCRSALELGGSRLGGLSAENVAHFLSSLAISAKITLHVDVLAGENSHHKAEAAFKALALALRQACAVTGGAVTGGAVAGGGGPGGGAGGESGPGSAGAGAGASAKGSVELRELSGDEYAAARGGA